MSTIPVTIEDPRLEAAGSSCSIGQTVLSRFSEISIQCHQVNLSIALRGAVFFISLEGLLVFKAQLESLPDLEDAVTQSWNLSYSAVTETLLVFSKIHIS